MPAQLCGTLRALNIGTVSAIVQGERRIVSAYHKQPVDGPMLLSIDGLPGDEHVYEHHGGPDKAVCVYPFEHYEYWTQRLDLDLPPQAAFGENFTVTGLLESEVQLGDEFEVGEAHVQVTQPRAPCYKIAARYGLPKMALYVQQQGMTGFHLRVLQHGFVRAGDLLRLVSRASHGISVSEANRILNHDKHDVAGALRLLDSVELPESLVPGLRKRIERHGEPADHARMYGDDPPG
ncbi:MOSC domain-containing protein [uncultured Jatrophihabitans sp.]|uniref:MOSC domain-containing protein n=1 Tax=uncultured Jatrophihabitans sp. TaxID=1610747 RepID=UPI0035CC6699